MEKNSSPGENDEHNFCPKNQCTESETGLKKGQIIDVSHLERKVEELEMRGLRVILEKMLKKKKEDIFYALKRHY